jgi:hypothetical protein
MRWTIPLLIAVPACVAQTGSRAPEDPGESQSEAAASTVESSSPVSGVPIVNVGSNLCLDVTAGSTAPGALLQQWGCWRGKNQAFSLNQLPSGAYEIRGGASTLCLGVVGAVAAEGARVEQSVCTGVASQEFALRQGAPGQYTLAAESTGLCLGIAGGGISNGAALVQWPCDGTPSQSFTTELPTGATPTGQSYYVASTGSDHDSGHAPDEAWQTLEKVSASAFQPGDAISFKRGGAFQGMLTVSSSGTRGRPITYGAYGAYGQAAPLLTGGSYGVSATSKSWVVVRDIQIHDTTHQGVFLVPPSNDESNTCTNWVIDDIDFEGTAGGVFASFASQILVENSIMHNGTAEFFYAWKGDSLHAIGNTIMTLYGTYTDNMQFEGTTNFEVRCNYATMVGSNSGKGSLISTDGAGGTVVDNTFIAGNYGFGDGDGSVTIANNQFIDNSSSDSWSSGIKIAGPLADGGPNNNINNVSIEHNLFVSPNMGIYIYDGNQVDPSGPGSRNNFTITGNVFEGAKTAMLIEDTLTASKLSGNTIWTKSSGQPEPASPIVLPTSCADGLSPHL